MIQPTSSDAYLASPAIGVTSLSTLELRRLLHELKGHSDACIRFRIVGKLWDKSFLQIKVVTEHGVTLYNPTTGENVEIHDLGDIIQFEIDKKYQNIQPHNHYAVTWTAQ